MIINGDCLEKMREMEDNSISCIVTDPPYGLGFMGKDWDVGLPHQEIWKEALRIIKPSGHLLAFGGTRTYHRLTCAIEDAGWQIRDCLMWIYGSGFPKSHNHFGIDGYGTALKPAYEPIIMAMKPCDGTFKQNAEKWDQAGININGCKIGISNRINPQNQVTWQKWKEQDGRNHKEVENKPDRIVQGRWPANILFDEEAARILDEQSGNLKSGSGDKHSKTQKGNTFNGLNPISGLGNYESDFGGASRFFYCAKASPRERNEGLEELPNKIGGGMNVTVHGDTRSGHITIQKNNHPTVKPIKLMEYLITLVVPPKDGILLDPFAGSGSTILAARRLGFNAIGIEKSEEYCKIARARLANIVPEKKDQLDLFAS